MHPGQLDVSVETVRGLVRHQFPEWADLPVDPVASTGTVNALFTIGDSLVARLPLVAEDVEVARRQVEREARAAREMLGRTRFPTPVPVAIGEPDRGYSLPWSVQTWLPGTVAFDADPAGSVGFAHDLAELITDLRGIDVRGRTHQGRGRGGDLRAHDDWVETGLRRSGKLVDVIRLRQLWHELRDLPRSDTGDVINHGDLTPGNLLVTDGRLTGVLDLGSLGPADPALDLVSAWHLLDASPRQVLRDDLQCDDVEWARGTAWALEQALGVVWYYIETNPVMSEMGRRTLERILASE